MSSRIKIKIIEYKNGRPMHIYDGIEECSTVYHCHQELIKGLIFTGNPFPYLEDNITFDIAPGCPHHIERSEVHDIKNYRYYRFTIVDDADGKPSEGKGRRLP